MRRRSSEFYGTVKACRLRHRPRSRRPGATNPTIIRQRTFEADESGRMPLTQGWFDPTWRSPRSPRHSAPDAARGTQVSTFGMPIRSVSVDSPGLLLLPPPWVGTRDIGVLECDRPGKRRRHDRQNDLHQVRRETLAIAELPDI